MGVSFNLCIKLLVLFLLVALLAVYIHLSALPTNPPNIMNESMKWASFLASMLLVPAIIILSIVLTANTGKTDPFAIQNKQIESLRHELTQVKDEYHSALNMIERQKKSPCQMLMAENMDRLSSEVSELKGHVIRLSHLKSLSNEIEKLQKEETDLATFVNNIEQRLNTQTSSIESLQQKSAKNRESVKALSTVVASSHQREPSDSENNQLTNILNQIQKIADESQRFKINNRNSEKTSTG